MIKRSFFFAAAPLALLLAPAAAQAQDTAAVTQRVDRLERELRAVQRRVFPGSENGLVTPDVGPPASADPWNATISSSAGDIAARLDALEAQLARLTGQVEQQGFRQREADTAVTRLRTEFDGRLDVLEAGAAAVTAASAPATTATPVTIPVPRPAAPRPTATTPAPVATRPPATRPTTTAAPRPSTAAPAATTPPANAARRAQVAAIEVPSSGNAAEDAYLYGYRLWEARLYPEAQAQLQRVLDTYPNHRRASYAGNLLGRAYLDNAQPSLAVRVLYDNYRNRPRGERAADSVYYMGMALIRLDRRTDACRTFDEFTNVYGDTASAGLKAQVTAARGTAGC
ncbi:MAG: tetratricopeptide repeat protein [Pseudomonadota bacterium]